MRGTQKYQSQGVAAKYRGIATCLANGEAGTQRRKEAPLANDEAHLSLQCQARQERKIASHQQTTCSQDREHGRDDRGLPLVQYQKNEHSML
jgi:hypothetical protein